MLANAMLCAECIIDGVHSMYELAVYACQCGLSKKISLAFIAGLWCIKRTKTSVSGLHTTIIFSPLAAAATAWRMICVCFLLVGPQRTAFTSSFVIEEA